MKIEAVSICVDYADFLAQAAPHNRRLLDRWVVVTRARDEETRMVCHKHSIECIVTEDFDRDTDFAKARGINAGLRQLRGDGWLLHLDSDIVLPSDFGECLDDAHLQQGSLYGCNRICLPGWDAWQAAQKQGLHSRHNGWLTEFRDRPQGSYVGGVPCGMKVGYRPIGFFQLWWGQETLSWGPTRKWYPEAHGGAARTDTQFAMLWDRKQCHLLPELAVFHLESIDAKDMMGQNWQGRKTPRFGPPVAAKSLEKGYPPPPTQSYTGRIVIAVSHPQPHLILDVERHGLKLFEVPADCPVTIRGHKKRFRDLRPGERATITGTGAHPITATSITIK